MKIIITESQSKNSLKSLIKDKGSSFASELVGGPKNLLKILNINSPMEFLHLFDDLDVVQSEEKQNLTLFRYKPKHNLMIYFKKEKYVFLEHYEIWSFLKDGFGLSRKKIERLTEEWLGEVYNLRDISSITNNYNVAWVL